MLDNLDWFANALCVGKTELFFTPTETESTKEKQRREAAAVAICKQCSVLSECLNYARSRGEHGIWGGETEDQRWRAGFVGVSTAVRRRSPAYYKNQRFISSRSV